MTSRLLERLHFWGALVPLVLLLATHLVVNAVGAFAPGRLRPLGLLLPGGLPVALEVLGLWVPLGWHLVYVLRFPQAPRAGRRRVLLALTGLGGLGFGVWHWWAARRPLLTGDALAIDSPNLLARGLSDVSPSGLPMPALAYLAGVSCVVLHAGWGSLTLWDRARPAPPHARRWRLAAVVTFTAFLLALGVGATLKYATGGLLH